MNVDQRRNIVFLSILFLCVGSAAVGLKSASAVIHPNAIQFSIKQRNPVVNEGNRIVLTATDAGGNPVDGARWSSGSPDIAAVDAATGEVRGVEQGFATVTATLNGESSSVFVVVARVRKGNGEKVPGDTKAGVDGRLYISSPTQNVILTATQILSAPVEVFAGTKGMRGLRNGEAGQSLFAGPTAIGVDNGARGGVYVTDTLNHGIRKIGFNRQVETVLGTGTPGVTAFDSAGKAAFEAVNLNAPRGAATDTGGNLFLADTDNHAIYHVDFANREVLLLAGKPGESGKVDGVGREARFSRPAGLAVDSTGRVLAVADADNNRVRLLELNKTESGELTCRVVTVGVASSARDADPMMRSQDREDDELVFNRPASVSFDGAGNVNVVDEAGAHVIVRPMGRTPEIVPLAQAGSFKRAASVTTSAVGVFVLDAEAGDSSESLNQVTVGAPEITDVSLGTVKLAGGEEVVVTGKNFAPESVVVLGDAPVGDLRVESATRIVFRVPRSVIHGGRTLSVQTRGGTAQRRIDVLPVPVSELSVGDITTIAGGGIPYIGDGRPATDPSIALTPDDVAVDGNGNLFIADFLRHRVRRVDALTGIITTVAGSGIQGFSGDGGLAVAARLAFPTKIALDGSGNLYMAANNRVRRVDAVTGIITTVAGNGTDLFAGEGSPAVESGFRPRDICLDRKGNLYIADDFNNRVFRVERETGKILTVAGGGRDGDGIGDGGPAVAAALARPFGVATDSVGNVFIADLYHHRIRRVDASSGIITTFAGKGEAGFSGDGASAVEACLSLPYAVGFDSADNLFLVDYSNARVRRVAADTGIITTVAGNGCTPGFLCPFADGIPAVDASLYILQGGGVEIDGFGNVFIADQEHYRVRKVDARTGIINTVAGNGKRVSLGEGEPASGADLQCRGLAVEPSGNILFGDLQAHRIRRIDAMTGRIFTIAGNGDDRYSGDGGPALNAGIFQPKSVDADSRGNIYISNGGNLRRADASGVIVKLGNAYGGVVVDEAGNVFIAQSGAIDRYDPKTGNFTRIAGNGGRRSNGDGGLAVEAGVQPEDVEVDDFGNVFLIDGNRVRRVDAKTGIITTVAGTKKGLVSEDGGGFSGDGGPAKKATLNVPRGISVDGGGNLFIADTGNYRVRRVDAETGIITTVAGIGPMFDTPDGDGGPAVKALVSAVDLAVDGNGNLLVADGSIRVIKGVAIPRRRDSRQ